MILFFNCVDIALECDAELSVCGVRCCWTIAQVLPSLMVNTMSLLYSLSLFVTMKWCVPTLEEVDEFHHHLLYDE